MLQQQQAAPKPGSMVSARRHVAVIGAGFSGLAAARTLLREGKAEGVAVTLLEASSVVGGRAQRGQLASGPVEMGATWFHGTQGNPVYDYTMQHVVPAAAASSIGSSDEERPKDYTANATGSDPRWGARYQLRLTAWRCCWEPVLRCLPLSIRQH